MGRWAYKRGDTFNLGGDASLLVDGVEETFSGVTIAAWIAPDGGQGTPSGAAFAQIAGAWLDQPNGLYELLVAKENTVAWPLGKAVMDVEFTWPDGRRVTTPTLPFTIVERVTHAT